MRDLTESQKILFLLAFTHELLRNSGGNIFTLEHIVEERETERGQASTEFTGILKQERKASEQQREKITRENIKQIFNIQKPEVGNPFKIIHPVLRVPEIRLPPRFNYLKPMPTNLRIDLGKINPLVEDPMVATIESSGPNQAVVVSGGMGRKPTNIILDRSDIDDIIDKFSKATKIPVHEGIFKVVYGRMIFSAIVSDVIGSKFVIQKMNYNPSFR